MRLVEALSELSYHESECVYVAPRDANGNTVSVSFSYIRRNDDHLEVLIANELEERLRKLLVAWNMWAAEQLTPNENDAF